MRPIDAEAFQKFIEQKDGGSEYTRYHFEEWLEQQPTIEAKPVVHAYWISASWEEDEEDGIENTYSDEFICSNCKEHLYFPDAIEKEDIGFSFCPYCGAQMDELVSKTDELNCSVKIPVISMEDVPKLMEE